MLWARLLAYVAGTVNQELLLRNEYLGAENRILKVQIKSRLLLSEEEKATLAEIAHRLPRSSVPRLGHNQAIGAIAHRQCRLIWLILHQGVRYDRRYTISKRLPLVLAAALAA